MRITETKQSRLRHYIGAPKRFLRRARDMYVDSMVSFDGKVASANVVACPAATHVSQLPKNFGGYSSSTRLNDDEYLTELYRSISDKYNWSSMEFNKDSLFERQQRVTGYRAMERNYSIALGKIGTIDEEEPCDFQEHVIMKSETLFPRSRSYAITRNSGFY